MKVQPGEARFGPELDGDKLWRGQVFGARMREKKRETGKKTCSRRIQKQRLAPKVRPWEARFGPELHGDKLCRGQLFGPGCARKMELFLFYIRIQKQCLAPKVRPWEVRGIEVRLGLCGSALTQGFQRRPKEWSF